MTASDVSYIIAVTIRNDARAKKSTPKKESLLVVLNMNPLILELSPHFRKED
jgi:hypothetical protein